MTTAAEAFKLGFCVALAEERVSAQDLCDMCTVVSEKVSAEGDKPKKPSPRPKADVDAMPDFSAITKTLGYAAPLAAATAFTLPQFAGQAAGGIGGQMLSAENDTLAQAKKRALIMKYTRLIEEMKIKKQNRLLSRVVKGEI